MRRRGSTASRRSRPRSPGPARTIWPRGRDSWATTWRIADDESVEQHELREACAEALLRRALEEIAEQAVEAPGRATIDEPRRHVDEGGVPDHRRGVPFDDVGC